MRLDRAKIGVLVQATGRYIELAEKLLVSMREHFLLERRSMTFAWLMTDDYGVEYLQRSEKIEAVHLNPNYPQKISCHIILSDQEPWPLPALLKYRYWLDCCEKWQHMDYVFIFDADLLLVGDVGDEIFGDGITAVRHSMFWQADDSAWLAGPEGPFEQDMNRTLAWVQPEHRRRWYDASVVGGTREAFYNMANRIANRTRDDLGRGVWPTWWDESYLNAYLSAIPPAVALPPGYAWRSNATGGSVQERIVVVDKDSDAFRRAPLARPRRAGIAPSRPSA